MNVVMNYDFLLFYDSFLCVLVIYVYRYIRNMFSSYCGNCFRYVSSFIERENCYNFVLVLLL